MGLFKRHTCDICEAVFARIEDMMQHQQLVHYKNHLYDCKKCNKYFQSMEEMRSHLQKVHSYKRD